MSRLGARVGSWRTYGSLTKRSVSLMILLGSAISESVECIGEYERVLLRLGDGEVDSWLRCGGGCGLVPRLTVDGRWLVGAV